MILAILLACTGARVEAPAPTGPAWRPPLDVEQAALILRSDLTLGAAEGPFRASLADLGVVERRWLTGLLAEDEEAGKNEIRRLLTALGREPVVKLPALAGAVPALAPRLFQDSSLRTLGAATSLRIALERDPGEALDAVVTLQAERISLLPLVLRYLSSADDLMVLESPAVCGWFSLPEENT